MRMPKINCHIAIPDRVFQQTAAKLDYITTKQGQTEVTIHMASKVEIYTQQRVSSVEL